MPLDQSLRRIPFKAQLLAVTGEWLLKTPRTGFRVVWTHITAINYASSVPELRFYYATAAGSGNESVAAKVFAAGLVNDFVTLDIKPGSERNREAGEVNESTYVKNVTSTNYTVVGWGYEEEVQT